MQYEMFVQRFVQGFDRNNIIQVFFVGSWLISSGQIIATSHDLTPERQLRRGNATPYFKEIWVGEILFHLARYQFMTSGGSFHVFWKLPEWSQKIVRSLGPGWVQGGIQDCVVKKSSTNVIEASHILCIKFFMVFNRGF